MIRHHHRYRWALKIRTVIDRASVFSHLKGHGYIRRQCQVNRNVRHGMKSSKPLYHRRRFTAEVISHCVCLYFRFLLTYLHVEEMMAARGVILSDETIRDWTLKFGGTYAKRMRSRAARPGDHWSMDEVYLSINGKFHYL